MSMIILYPASTVKVVDFVQPVAMNTQEHGAAPVWIASPTDIAPYEAGSPVATLTVHRTRSSFYTPERGHRPTIAGVFHMLQFFSASTRMANPQRAFMQCPAGRSCHHNDTTTPATLYRKP